MEPTIHPFQNQVANTDDNNDNADDTNNINADDTGN